MQLWLAKPLRQYTSELHENLIHVKTPSFNLRVITTNLNSRNWVINTDNSQHVIAAFHLWWKHVKWASWLRQKQERNSYVAEKLLSSCEKYFLSEHEKRRNEVNCRVNWWWTVPKTHCVMQQMKTFHLDSGRSQIYSKEIFDRQRKNHENWFILLLQSILLRCVNF